MSLNFVKKIYISVLLAGVFLGSLFLGSYAGGQQANLSSKVLRLHIIGNTNTTADQTLKLLVRDSILKEHHNLFEEAQTTGDAELRARLSVNLIKETAQQTLQRNGCLAPVSVQVEEVPFPTKRYGNVQLPAGNYTAVNVRLGSASGENWWCVLYPPLCLTEGSVKADEKTLALLKSELSSEEYALITEPETVSLKLKFRLLELLGELFS